MSLGPVNRIIGMWSIRRKLNGIREFMSKKSVAELLIERLMQWGVDTIFSLPGDGINGIYEVLRINEKKIKLVQVRHEEAAAFAAWNHLVLVSSLVAYSRN